MFKELITATLVATAPIPISNAIQRLTTTVNINYTNWSTQYTDEAWESDILERCEYIKCKNTEPILYTNGVATISQYIIQYDIVDTTVPYDKYIKRIQIITKNINNTEALNYLSLALEGTINSLYSSNYTSIVLESYASSQTTNIEVERMLQGNRPTNYTDMKDLFIHPDLVSKQLVYNNTMSNIQELKEAFTMFNFQQNGTIYTETEISIQYDDATITTANQINDTFYFPTSSKLTIDYQAEVDNTTEVVDVPGLMFTILGMPFAWISTAFNLTIFPGTIYEVNLAHIFLAVVIGGIAIFIIKRILK